jgi:hypothetical protein
MRIRRKLKEGWDDVVFANLYRLHDSTDALEDQVANLMERYAELEASYATLANSYRELKLKIK